MSDYQSCKSCRRIMDAVTETGDCIICTRLNTLEDQAEKTTEILTNVAFILESLQRFFKNLRGGD